MSTLTNRELQVLRLTCQGISGKQMARELGVTYSTIRAHRTAIRDKAGKRKEVTLLLWAIRNGLFCPWCKPVRDCTAENLKPCPFCGEQYELIADSKFITCNECGSKGPVGKWGNRA